MEELDDAPAVTSTSTTAPQVGTTEPPAGDDNEPLSMAEARKLRSEAKNLRQRLKAFEEADRQAKEAQMSEQQKLQRQYDELHQTHTAYTQRMQERLVQYEMEKQASRLGIIDPDAVKMLDWTQLEFEEDGTPSNAGKLLEQLVKEKPYLVGKPQAGSYVGATNPPRSHTNSPLPLSWDLISKLSPQEYDQRRGEIQQWMRQNPPRQGMKVR